MVLPKFSESAPKDAEAPQLVPSVCPAVGPAPYRLLARFSEDSEMVLVV
jgi:hypothetical protein